METMVQRLYPVGIQTFTKIREGDYIYIDKTEYVYRMTHSGLSSVFLSRPRRFGKSLLTSTLHSYFEGRKELFEGLAIEHFEKDWTVHPVLHFDMSTAKHMDKERLVSELERKLLKYEEIYGRGEGDIEPNQRLQGLIERAYKQTGQRVVVLIDEYDAPLLDVVHEENTLPMLRNVMRNFYSPLKACDPYLRFVFLTGITPLLYQSGYLTIKDYDKIVRVYTLDIPNKEVRIGLMESLIPEYITNDTLTTTTVVANLARALLHDDMEGALHLLQSFLSTVPYCENARSEGHFQQVFYIIFSLLGAYVDVEVRTPRGRVDLVVRTGTVLYVMELKLDKTADDAMQQINLKDYPERFALCGLPVVKVAVNFDSERHTLEDWKIERI